MCHTEAAEQRWSTDGFVYWHELYLYKVCFSFWLSCLPAIRHAQKWNEDCDSG
ncbi:hypothetical protein BRO54_0681 [Geobacillus proteiniphilus]|uniref:Uncharacterized protein n=1 Tax=Geobacillus proteiniphilus TaxID=860353 RepID=A0A1Q5T741_9BACL|nr:hypothetical protein BRO54_0681 [Geobacillus proteiniphilus]